MPTNPWVDRYVAEVGRLAPTRQRADLELEIRSLLQDELDALPAESAGSEAATFDVLRKFGSPAAMAARYGAAQHLIGPELYPYFLMVLRIVLVVIFGVWLFGLVVSAATENANIVAVSTFVSLVSSLLQSAAVVVLVFAIIERVAKVQQSSPHAAWDPRSLPSVNDPNRIKWGEMVLELVLGTMGIVALLFFPNQLGGYWANGEWHALNIFSSEFLAFVPWMAAIWALEVIVKLVIMARGRWETATRAADLLVSGLSLMLLFRMLAADALSAWPPLEFTFTIGIIVAIVIVAIEILRTAWLLVSHGRTPALESLTVQTPHTSA